MDVDDFKHVNDAFGHQAGDAVLADIAGRLKGLTRETDLVARQGGDEFLVMIPDIEPEEGVADPTSRAQRIVSMMTKRIQRSMLDPFDINGSHVRITLSVGSSLFPADALDAHSLLRNSDAAGTSGRRRSEPATRRHASRP